MESYALIVLEIISTLIKNYEDAKANPATVADAIAKATAAKAALATEAAGFAADDAEAHQNLVDRLKP